MSTPSETLPTRLRVEAAEMRCIAEDWQKVVTLPTLHEAQIRMAALMDAAADEIERLAVSVARLTAEAICPACVTEERESPERSSWCDTHYAQKIRDIDAWCARAERAEARNDFREAEVNGVMYRELVATRERATKAEARAIAAETERARLLARVRELPSPWDCVTAGANPQRDGTMSPPMWHCHCCWCDAKATVTQWKHPVSEGHPANGCLWVEATASGPSDPPESNEP